MSYKRGVDKRQLTLLPTSLDEYVPEEHICRVINAFTKQLNIETLGYKYSECKATGCRPYDPRMMLNLYIYGYLHRVRSSRRLRDETERNVEVMWLMDGLRPDDKTISNFRKDNTGALRETYREFVKMCRRLDLYGGEIEATDSMKVKAQNSLKKHYSETVVKNEITRIDKKISEYLNALEEADKEEEGERRPGRGSIKAALEYLAKKKEKYEKLSERVAAEGEISTVDPDARMMRNGGDGRRLDVGYNVQTVVDSKNHLIVEFEVNNCSSDSGQLHKMSEKAKEILEVEMITNLADSGYYNGEDIAACEADGVTCLVPKHTTGPKKAEGYDHSDFIYERESDSYICPCGNRMEYKHVKKRSANGKENRRYVNQEACRQCPRKSECTTYRYREILRLVYQDTLDKVDERTRENKELYRKRQEIVEHVFGTVKGVWGYRQFLCRGNPKVTAETAMAYLAYNMRRFFNINKENGLKLALG